MYFLFCKYFSTKKWAAFSSFKEKQPACYQKCPAKKIPSEFDAALGTRTAIYTPFPQAVPNKPVIDAEHCIKLTKGKCGLCEKICPTGAIRYDDKDDQVQVKVGAIVLATGFELWDHSAYGEYGAGKLFSF